CASYYSIYYYAMDYW
nr:immunoglobulin heavy chain junction region [Mus musculus]NSM04122.1 immunoglobulin heavy chain junction region [Mus musculus]NSM04923.1 immunoglobulin heavy chain junction region [Mus musculus]NSM05423.1 immunoglobulin heavy chain junction region [Mus musculus]NSM06028.1 immunoglobulin heavy chain junction region [Mus musculus]